MIIHHGKGLLNKIINSLPVELHIPGYQYCGPGTKLEKRLARGDPGINPLDAACKEHDIAYSKSNNLIDRHEADKILAEKAWQRVKSHDASIGERIAAWTVTNAMKAKRKFGMGHKRGGRPHLQSLKKHKSCNNRNQKNVFRNAVRNARAAIKQAKIKNDITKAITVAVRAAKSSVRGKKNKKPTSRVIPIPKSGGVLPFLIPLFAGLSATGALAGGAAGIAKAVNDASAAKKQLQEATRHNKIMEAIAVGKHGNGLYLKPYRKGLGLFL